MKIVIKITLKEYKAFVLSNKVVKIFFAILFLIILNVSVMVLLGHGEDMILQLEDNYFSLIAAILFYIILPIYYFNSIKKRYETHKLLHEEMTYEF